MEQKLFGGVELGGTKTICAAGAPNGNIIAHTSFPTTTVDETAETIANFFNNCNPVLGLGVGSFGPLELSIDAARFGFMLNTPKPGWANIDLLNILKDKLQVPICLDTDVNCAALGEYYFGASKNINNIVYLTVGTGIGGSLMVDGKLVYGHSHLEMGHMRIMHEPFEDSFKGTCPFHDDCLEGIASGHAIEQRYGIKGEDVTDEAVWQLEAKYIAQAINNIILTIGPDKIILGGGVMQHTSLVENVRVEVSKLINSYIKLPNLDSYIIASSSELNGTLGAIKLASLSI